MYQQIILIGNVGQEPELRHTANGTPVCNFRLAVHRRWTTQSGEKNEKTTWFRVTAWQKQAETVSQYLTKGRQVMVIGEVEEASTYTSKTGDLATTIEVTARLIKFLSGDGHGEHSELGDEENISGFPGQEIAPSRRRLATADIPF